MLKKFMNKKLVKNEKGLTLVELLAVIVILAIIAAIAVPAIGNIIENSRYNAVKSDALNVITAGTLYYTDNPNGEADGEADTKEQVTVEKLIETGYLENPGSIESSAAVKNANPKTLKGTAQFSDKTITFEDNTMEDINKDTQKGSQIKDEKYAIPKVSK